MFEYNFSIIIVSYIVDWEAKGSNFFENFLSGTSVSGSAFSLVLLMQIQLNLRGLKLQ